jgi:hypothetical protein
MLLANDLSTWLADQQLKLAGYAEQIQTAIDHNDWEGLSVILVNRQAYLESLLSPPPSNQHLAAIRPVIEAVLTQDQAFQAAIQSQKQLLKSQQQDITRNRKAIQLYSG